MKRYRMAAAILGLVAGATMWVRADAPMPARRAIGREDTVVDPLHHGAGIQLQQHTHLVGSQQRVGMNRFHKFLVLGFVAVRRVLPSSSTCLRVEAIQRIPETDPMSETREGHEDRVALKRSITRTWGLA